MKNGRTSCEKLWKMLRRKAGTESLRKWCKRLRRKWAPASICTEVKDHLHEMLTNKLNSKAADEELLALITPETAKEKSPVRRAAWLRMPSLACRLALRRSHARVGWWEQNGYLPLHLAAIYKASEGVVRALLEAYPEGAKQEDYVREHEAWPGWLPLARTRCLRRSVAHARVAWPPHRLQHGVLPKDYYRGDDEAIKKLLS